MTLRIPDYWLPAMLGYLALCMITGCETTPPKPKPEVVDRVETRAPNPHQAEIDQLLAEAREALMADRLTTPLEDNAYYRYLRVLSLDPDNAWANLGISDIVEKYLDWALEAASEHKLHSATDFLNKARSVDETHPNIQAVALKIDTLQNAEQKYYRLDRVALSNRTNALVAELHRIGKLIESKNARATITAPSDSAARWIYQQLNDATEYRVRAKIEIASAPGIRLIY